MQQVVRKYSGHSATILAVCVADVGGTEFIFTGSQDWSARAFEVSSGAQLAAYTASTYTASAYIASTYTASTYIASAYIASAYIASTYIALPT